MKKQSKAVPKNTENELHKNRTDRGSSKRLEFSDFEELPPERILHLHAAFTSPGAVEDRSIGKWINFVNLMSEALNLRTRKRNAEFKARKRTQRKLAGVVQQLEDLCRLQTPGEIDVKSANKKPNKFLLDAETNTDLLESPSHPLNQSDVLTGDLAAANLSLVNASKILKATEQANRSLEILSKFAQSGEKDAIKDLASIAEMAIAFLIVAEKLHPDVTREVAGMRMHWPLLASNEPGWERRGVQRVKALGLGSDLSYLRTTFRVARGTDENYPARKWAKAAVRTIEETRQRVLIFGEYREEFADLILKVDIELGPTPEWAEKAWKLERFSSASVREWGNLIREMIREQFPEFHTAPEWINQRNTAERNCRDSRGEIQNAILDDIVSALSPIAPDAVLPKLES